MMNARGIARLGMLAVGLGIGAAVASTPGVASADSSTDWLPSIDNVLGAATIPVVSAPLDIQISVDGHDLFPTTDNTAFAESSAGDIAIADGDGADASAVGGDGDVADASGTDALAVAGGSTGSNFDTAIDIGNNTVAVQPYPDGAYANAVGSPGSFDTAVDLGNNNQVWATIGNDDSASVVGNNSDGYAGGDFYDPSATGNHDIATVFDPFGTVGSYANAGATEGVDGTSGNSDLAAALFIDGAGVNVAGVSDVADVNGEALSGAATTGGTLLADLLSLF
jgi:hypothetical protein